jgi:hypothetical protein
MHNPDQKEHAIRRDIVYNTAYNSGGPLPILPLG